MRKIITVALLLATLGVGAILAGNARAANCTTTCHPTPGGSSNCFTRCF